MTNPIKGPNGPGEIGAAHTVDATSSTDANAGVGFDTVLASEQAGALEGATVDPAVEAAVQNVAEDLRVGRISDPSQAIEAVIDRIVDIRFSHIQPDTRKQMADDLRAVLMDDPFFVLEVEELIGHALDPG